MAHFAKLDENNIVTDVVVVDNKDILDENGNEQEEIGIQYLKNLFGENTKWVQTSYNHNFRLCYANIGGTYDAERDIFINFPPYPSWTFNYETLGYDAPTPLPEDHETVRYIWRESDLSWVQLTPRPDDPENFYIFNVETEEWEKIV